MVVISSKPNQRIKGNATDVYLLIGQSNMAGRGYMTDQDSVDRFDRIFLLNREGKPVEATNPFNQYSSVRKEINMQGINPGVGFSMFMREHTKHNIILVVNAIGGSKLDEWMPDTKYFSEAIKRTRQAQNYGRLKGILWHQGCSDSSDSLRNIYMNKLMTMVESLRDSLDAEMVPFIAGELPEWRESSPAFNDMINTISEHIPLSACVSSKGCTMREAPSDPHFSRDGQLILGRRYGEQMLKLQKARRHSRKKNNMRNF